MQQNVQLLENMSHTMLHGKPHRDASTIVKQWEAIQKRPHPPPVLPPRITTPPVVMSYQKVSPTTAVIATHPSITTPIVADGVKLNTALVDTGACVNVISADMIQKIAHKAGWTHKQFSIDSRRLRCVKCMWLTDGNQWCTVLCICRSV